MSLLFIYCACYAFLLIDVLIVCAMPEPIRTGWLLSEQVSEGPVIGTSQSEGCSGPHFWKCFIITKSTFFFVIPKVNNDYQCKQNQNFAYV